MSVGAISTLPGCEPAHRDETAQWFSAGLHELQGTPNPTFSNWCEAMIKTAIPRGHDPERVRGYFVQEGVPCGGQEGSDMQSRGKPEPQLPELVGASRSGGLETSLLGKGF